MNQDNKEAEFRTTLERCAKTKDLYTAMALYSSLDSPISDGNILNCFLYICSNSLADPQTRKAAIDFGLTLFDTHTNTNITPNEATLTAAAKLAAANKDGDYAFSLAISVKEYGFAPKIRTFAPALHYFCTALNEEKAYEVQNHVESEGVHLEEPEIAALLKMSVELGREDKIYDYMHKLRRVLKGIDESTVAIIEGWFKIKRADDWVVRRSKIASIGRCCACQEELVCSDIDRADTHKLAKSMADTNNLAKSKADTHNLAKSMADFKEFEIEAVLQSTQKPLIILPSKRVQDLKDDSQKKIEKWFNQRILYQTPFGLEDDWYCIYAAAKLNCLLVTNDELRDHISKLRGSCSFIRWKESHQVRFTFIKGNLELTMPLPYSVVIQESAKGWHIPLAGDATDESSRSWLCVTKISLS